MPHPLDVPEILHVDPGETFQEVATIKRDKKGVLVVSRKGKKEPKTTKYKQYEGTHGEILLVPIVELLEREAWLYQNPEALASVHRGLQQSTQGKVNYLGDFTQFADDSIEET
ncbi:MAG: hypothetical protein HY692_04705 [Cyanobacteria bacterium NC_groundwater_1444_Ag_S-0.65um_54_12]|nr:hypothetical protein [Cyanobacteria bacterium NC_groundwater_1444_Ag_S-0.65um_54_12]